MTGENYSSCLCCCCSCGVLGRPVDRIEIQKGMLELVMRWSDVSVAWCWNNDRWK